MPKQHFFLSIEAAVAFKYILVDRQRLPVPVVADSLCIHLPSPLDENALLSNHARLLVQLTLLFRRQIVIEIVFDLLTHQLFFYLAVYWVQPCPRLPPRLINHLHFVRIEFIPRFPLLCLLDLVQLVGILLNQLQLLEILQHLGIHFLLRVSDNTMRIQELTLLHLRRQRLHRAPIPLPQSPYQLLPPLHMPRQQQLHIERHSIHVPILLPHHIREYLFAELLSLHGVV